MCRGCCSCAWEVAIRIDTMNYASFAIQALRPGPDRQPCHVNGEIIDQWKNLRRTGPGWVFECHMNTMKYKGRYIEVWTEFPNGELAINVKLITNGNQTRDTILSKMTGMCGGSKTLPGANRGVIDGLETGRVQYPCSDCAFESGGAGRCGCRGRRRHPPPLTLTHMRMCSDARGAAAYSSCSLDPLCSSSSSIPPFTSPSDLFCAAQSIWSPKRRI